MKKSRLLGAVCVGVLILFSISSHAAPVSRQGSWEVTLKARDFDGNLNTVEGYYDNVLNITWLADANAGVGSVYDSSQPGTGIMDWNGATAWAAGLTINGITNWRLPTMVDIGNDACNYSNTGGTDCGYNVLTVSGGTVYSEMASMFYDTLGNLGFVSTSGVIPQPGWGLSNTGPFENLGPFGSSGGIYWSGLELNQWPYTDDAWDFYFNQGLQEISNKGAGGLAWAVHDGDVGTPIYDDNDSDGDGLPDTIEDRNGNWIFDPGETDLLNPDSDNDGLLDGEEDSNANGIIDVGETNPLDFDSDDDGLTDGYEINVSGTDPNTTTILIPGDMNGDGVVNAGDSVLHMREVLGY